MLRYAPAKKKSHVSPQVLRPGTEPWNRPAHLISFTLRAAFLRIVITALLLSGDTSEGPMTFVPLPTGRDSFVAPLYIQRSKYHERILRQ